MFEVHSRGLTVLATRKHHTHEHHDGCEADSRVNGIKMFIRMNRSTFFAFLAASVSVVSGFVLPSFSAPRGQASSLSSSHHCAGLGMIDRRLTLESILYTYGTILMWPSNAGAEEAAPLLVEGMPTATTTTKPYATLDALLPAARVKLIIDKSVIVASELTNDDTNDSNKKKQLVQELQALLLKPQNYTRSSTLAAVPQQPAKQYLDTYKQNLNRSSILEKPGGMLVQSGEIDTWKRLKRQERAREREMTRFELP